MRPCCPSSAFILCPGVICNICVPMDCFAHLPTLSFFLPLAPFFLLPSAPFLFFNHSHVCSVRDVTFTATESGRILVWRRARMLRELTLGSVSSPVVSLLPLQTLLLSLHEDGSLCVWDGAASASRSTTSPAPASYLISRHALPSQLGSPTALLHPDTYINKVVVGTSEGGVAIFNFRSGTLVHVCKVLPTGVPVTCLAQSPAVDVVAVGGGNGTIAVYNLRMDAQIMAFTHTRGSAGEGSSGSGSGSSSGSGGQHSGDGSCAVTAVAFSGASNTLTQSLLVSAGEGGSLAFWNLERRSLNSLLPSAHGGVVASSPAFSSRAGAAGSSGGGGGTSPTSPSSQGSPWC